MDVDVLWRFKGGVRCCALHTCTLGEYRDSEIETELLLEGVEGLGQPLGLCRYLRAGRSDCGASKPVVESELPLSAAFVWRVGYCWKWSPV